MNMVTSQGAGKSAAPMHLFWWIVLHDTPGERLRVYAEELATARARDAARGTRRGLPPEVRATLATHRVFAIARQGWSPRGGCVGRDAAFEDADPILDALRDGATVRRIVSLAYAAQAWDMLADLASSRGVSVRMRAAIAEYLMLASVHEAS